MNKISLSTRIKILQKKPWGCWLDMDTLGQDGNELALVDPAKRKKRGMGNLKDKPTEPFNIEFDKDVHVIGPIGKKMVNGLGLDLEGNHVDLVFAKFLEPADAEEAKCHKDGQILLGRQRIKVKS
ncbi:hypothetical protein Tco_0307918 [Tanacetum coccineum]